MKIILSIIAVLILNNDIHFDESNPIKILPNIGIDNIKLKESQPEDVKAFRGIEYSKSTYLTIRCGNADGKRLKFTSYYSDSAGICFTFFQKEKSRFFPIWTKLELTSIELTKGIKTSDNLVVGQSSKDEVLKIYGPLPTGWRHDRYIVF